MAYLDRPVPAGYFIFPDLSVRHEGKYRLSFNLFEELKEEKDADVNAPAKNTIKLLGSNPMGPHAHVHFRLEVKSEPFVVYSAKKFPGLAESTNLSRVVTEQGCRVRIRRDVRMRRRDNKPAKDFEEYEEEGTAYRQDGYTTPDPYAHNAAAERARSVSASSVDGNMHQYPAVDRRTSSHDSTFYNQAPYQHAPIAAPVPQQPINFNSHLTFGTASQYQAPTMPTTMPQAAQHPFQFGQQQLKQEQQQPPLNGHSRHTSSSSNHDYAVSQPMQQQPLFPTTQPYPETIVQRPAHQAALQPAREPNNYPAIDTKFIANNQPYFIQNSAIDTRSATPSNPPQILPSIKTIQPLDRSSISGPLAVSSPSTGYEQGSGAYPFAPNQMTPVRNGKRAYDRVFDTTHINSSVADGARPEAVGQDMLQIEADEEGLVDEDHYAALRMLSYRRADGTRHHKKIPSPIS